MSISTLCKNGVVPSSWRFTTTGKERLKTKTVNNNVNSKDIHDLTELEDITFDNVLNCLVERYTVKQFYTFAGEMLISLNPCLKNSRKSLSDDQLTVQFETYDENERPPHIFSVGKKCVNNLISIGTNQVIVVSGNSGAGKTTATQQLLRYFVERGRRKSETQTSNSLDRKIYFATMILESLGNASTAVNPNSSRFGRFVKLNYNLESGNIVGAQIQTCLLEKHRVSKCSPFERNFHIFYYIFVSLEKGLFGLSDFMENCGIGIEWKTLIPHYFQESVKPSDEEELLTLYQSLMSLKMTAELEKVFGIIFGIMILLNIRFVPSEEQFCNNDLDKEFESVEEKEFTIGDINAVETLADIFGVDSQALTDILVARRITAGGGSRRRSVFRKPCQSVRECEERAAALTSHLYDCLFQHVLFRVNSMLTISKNESSGADTSVLTNYLRANKVKTISLLDLYGFEKLENNQLEQLCINYANERLQKVHILSMKSQLNEMKNWELNFKAVELDNVVEESSERIDCLHNCVFQILNEECLLNRVTTSDLEVFRRLGISTTDKKHVELGKAHDPLCPFVVKHYAMDVQYELKGMIRKNSDNIPPEFNELLESSSRLFLKSLISSLNLQGSEMTQLHNGTKMSTPFPKNMNPKNKSQREKTILQRFKVSVDNLMNELGVEESQEIHFIRCIRPNNELAEGKVQRETVRQQLFSSGIVDIIRITGNGFPIRIAQSKFCKDIQNVVNRFIPSTDSENLDVIFRGVFNFNETDIKLGNTQIFLTEMSWKFLLKLDALIMRSSVICLQRKWRSYTKRKGDAIAKAQEIHELNLSHLVSSTESQDKTYEVDLCGGGEKIAPWLPPISTSTLPSSSENNDKLKQPHQRVTFKAAIEKLQPIMSRLNLSSGHGIVTRGTLYEGPIRMYVKKTVLPYGHVIPNRLKPRGLMDLLDQEQ